ncbi:ABC transporter substrate-binding protein [Sphingobacterium corticibacter]|uniref:Amino acid ABC transporter substrate-binding protein n=1 Tax=Sphingobacterium corticibacter TaxID=2171749 RepID=A0A2T8HHX8_9SPHI|nr:hypothetical protein [Sphingobacterium corticibacter]PVH25039.1 hypothetical protein DC487_08880 [Sphingobacterium corticibacter]
MKCTYLIGFFAAALAVSSCSPKTTTGVLRAPGQTTGKVDGTKDQSEADREDKSGDTDIALSNKAKRYPGGTIALLLPFQLDRVAGSAVSEEDVKRSALALDFYQGFQMGLDQTVKSNKRVELQVLDSRDNAGHNANLARSQEIKDASLIIGPVYPAEIKAFSASLPSNNRVLQVNPLAATMPTEFNLPNLVSVTPPISIHMRAISAELSKNYKEGDVILIYNTANSDHQQFIQGFPADIKERLPYAEVISVSSPSELNDKLNSRVVYHIISGTTDRNQLKALLNVMDERSMSDNLEFRLYGHPLWNRVDFSSYSNFTFYRPVISSESHLNPLSNATRDFQSSYKNAYGVEPSDHAYKGFDSGTYFGNLLQKYGRDYAEHINKETFEGLYSNYKFNRNERWGYVNFGVSLMEYRFGKFQAR